MNNLFITTFNCAKLPQLQFPELIQTKFPIEKPDLFVFGFQELLSIYDSTFDEYSNSYLLNFGNELVAKINQLYNNDYVLVKSESFGSIGLVLITLKSNIDKINSISIQKISFGYFYSNLKSSILVNFKYADTDYSFINSHFTANEGMVNLNKRNANYWEIMNNLKINDKNILVQNGHVFFLGDLNYRCLKFDESENLLTNDELINSINLKKSFVGFKESAINFKQTYKFNLGSNDYNLKRIPSYCDRILYRKYDNDEEEILSYDSLFDIKTSDHRPVYLNIKVNSVPTTKITHTSDEYFELKQAIGQVSTSLIKTSFFLIFTKNGRILSFLLILLLFYSLY